ncbi:MAG: ABC transporter [Oscillospiraceae bacterium]|jgi:ABC-2 type transport system permease protein|nr:ABC transporter [Oscillospiraceae bacterium]
MAAIFKRELKSYYTGLTGYVIAAVLLGFTGMYTVTLNLTYGYPNFEYVLDSMTLVYIVLIPLLTMRLIAGERRQKTDTLLYSLPLTSGDVVLGKFLAAWTALALPMAVAGLYPLILGRFGTVNYATAYAGLLAFLLMGGALISIGLFLSALTESQFVAGALCFAVMLADFSAYSLSLYVSGASYVSFMTLMAGGLVIAAVLWYLTKNIAAGLAFAVVADGAMLVCYLLSPALFGGVMSKILQALCVFIRMTGFINGVFDWQAVVYFLSVTAVCLFLTAQALEKRRWS